MSIKISQLKRIIKYNGTTLRDPGPEFSLEDIRSTYAKLYPELTTALLSEPEVTDESITYEFVKNVGTKG